MGMAEEQSLLRLFEEIVPVERWRELEPESGAQIYTLPVVVWLMLLQRLQPQGTQQAAVHEVAAGRLDPLLPESKRVREGNISASTGGYARACGRVSRSVLERVCDEVLRELQKRIAAEPEWEFPVLLLDGTTVSVEHVSGLLEAFPPCRNQHGQGHWGTLTLVALHDLRSGIALRPCWGPMYGPEPVSEQRLAEQVVEQAPAGSVILGDGNFGVFSCAYAVARSQRQVLFRLTKARAEALGAAALLPGGERKLCWRPSRQDRRAHPELPPEAQVEGRLLVATGKGFRETVYLFTTLAGDGQAIVALYARRWNMELDLRSLKRTMRLHHLRGKSVAAIEKELLIAVVGYGLVRACMALAAQRSGVAPRQLSFTRCHGLLNAMVGKLTSPLPEQRQSNFDRILRYMSQAKLPQRSQSRSYPRAVWGFRQDFPYRRPPTTGGQM